MSDPSDKSGSAIKPWPHEGSEVLGRYRIFDVRMDRRRSPRTDKVGEFYVLDAPNWVNVVAITKDRQIVMIEQYRHGTETIELEIPGGMIDPEDPDPVAAGVRELREETGYGGENERLLGEMAPNPAIMNNTCYTGLVEGCEKRFPLEWDEGEDIALKLIDVDLIPSLITGGRVRHSLVTVALSYYFMANRTA